MANFSSRNILICVVPAVVILLSMFWFKKKKRKLELSSLNQNTVCATKSNTFDVQANIYSSIESTSDFSNTLSDASSISSPENSFRTENTCETSSDDAANDSGIKEIVSISNHVHHMNYKDISFSKEQPITNCNSQIANSKKSGKMNAVTSVISDELILTDCDNETESINDSLLLNLQEKRSNLLHNYEVTLDKEQFKNTANQDPDISCSLLSINSVFEHNGQKNSITEDYSIENNLEESVISEIQNTLLSHSLNDPDEISIVSETNKLNEADSHSSVLDENSLSSMSDESERQTDQQYKDSPSSVFDGNSISDESVKVDISNVQVASQLEENSNVLNFSSDVIQQSSVSNGQYSVQLKKNSVLAKTILSETIANEIYNFDEVGVHSPARLQDSDSFISDNLQSSSEPFLVSQADSNVVKHNNQCTLTDVDSYTDTQNISLASVSDTISSTTEDIVSSTVLQSRNLEVGQSETDTNQLGCDTTVSSSTAAVTFDKDVQKDSDQLDSITSVQANSSVTDSIKTQDNQIESLSQTKVIGTDVVDVKSAGMIPGLFVYEFDLPQELCGRLIGKQGKHVKSIKERTNANVFIKRHPFDSNLKTVVVEGSRTAVHEALDIIRRKFPPSQFPTVTLLQTNMMSNSHGISLPESLQLHLPEGASCDVILSSLVSAGHFFLQQPTHPTYPSLSTLDQCMINCYSPMDTPSLPHPVEAGVICAAPVMNGWYRAQVIYVYENRSECEVKFVDYGGFQQVLTSSLRQIRSDFMTLPFQASECYLANVRPVDCNAGWSAEATSVFEELAQGQILQALIIEYAEDGIPCVQLYKVQGVSNMFINRELVERGLAVWVDNCHWDPH